MTFRPRFSLGDIAELNRRFEGAHPRDILAWAQDVFGSAIASSSSFQTQSLPLLHMISQVVPALPIVFLDTGYHFPETIRYRDLLVDRLGLTLRIARADNPPSVSRRGAELYRDDPDLCCHVHKVEPMRRAMDGLEAWISGVRRDQAASRRDLQIVELARNLIRIHPLASWTARDVSSYISEHGLPEHPLFSEGYVSVGCWPCTRPIRVGENERAGRWSGIGKTECGLHTDLRSEPVRKGGEE